MTKRILTTICILFFALIASASAYQEPTVKPSEQTDPNAKLISIKQSPAAPALDQSFNTASPNFSSSVKPGDTITYDITAKNGACYDTTPVITAKAEGATLISASVVTQNSENDWRVTSGTVGGLAQVTWTTPSYLLKNETVVVRMVVRVNANLTNGSFIQFKKTYYSANGDDEAVLCTFSGPSDYSSSGYHIVIVEEPDTHHELLPPIYEGVKTSLAGIHDLSAAVTSVNNNVNLAKGYIITVNNNLLAVNDNINTRFTSLEGRINGVSNLVSSRFDSLQTNLNAVSTGINNRLTGIEGGINGVSNLVFSSFSALHNDLTGVNNNINNRFTTLTDNVNTRFSSLQNTANTINNIAAQTLDAVNNIRGTTASMVSQLNVLQTSANTANAKLDVVNNKADSTLNKIDAATAKVEALQNTANTLNAKIDDVLTKLAASQQSALQFQIEAALVEGDRYNLASLQMPRSLGGYLEDVRELVSRVYEGCSKSGLPLSVIAQAAQELQNGDESMKAKVYKDAYEHYRAAYLHLSIVPGNRRP